MCVFNLLGWSDLLDSGKLVLDWFRDCWPQKQVNDYCETSESISKIRGGGFGTHCHVWLELQNYPLESKSNKWRKKNEKLVSAGKFLQRFFWTREFYSLIFFNFNKQLKKKKLWAEIWYTYSIVYNKNKITIRSQHLTALYELYVFIVFGGLYSKNRPKSATSPLP